jgi:hypothetical protein
VSFTLWYFLVEKLGRIRYFGGDSSTNRSASAGTGRSLLGRGFLETLGSYFGIRGGRPLLMG